MLAGWAFVALPNVSCAEELRSTSPDAVIHTGEFSISNDTGMTIHYFVKWGNKSNWTPIALADHRVKTYSHSLALTRRQLEGANRVCEF